MKKFIAGIVALLTCLPFYAFAATPTPADTLPVSGHALASGTGFSFTYTVPAGSNLVEIFLLAIGGNVSASLTATQNGGSFTDTHIGCLSRACYDYGYIVGPSSGTFSMTWTGNNSAELTVVTFQSAAQSTPIDTSNSASGAASVNLTTNVGNDALIDYFCIAGGTITGHGSGQTEVLAAAVGFDCTFYTSSWKAAASSAGSETMSETSSGTSAFDIFAIAIKLQASSVIIVPKIPDIISW